MSNGITRRELLGLALASPMAAALSFKGVAREGKGEGLDRSLIANSPGRVVGEGGAEDAAQVKLIREWRGPICRSRVVNRGRAGVRLKEVVLFDIAHHLPPETWLYGEGFQMLSQTGGTLGQPVNLSQYTDAGHYKLPAPADAHVFYGMMTLAPPPTSRMTLCASESSPAPALRARSASSTGRTRRGQSRCVCPRPVRSAITGAAKI
jgi:alpha-galactosidase